MEFWKYSAIKSTILVMVLLVFICPALVAKDLMDPLQLEGPVASSFAVDAISKLPVIQTETIDIALARQEDLQRENMGLPPRFAIPQIVSVTPENSGKWEELGNGYSLWRYRINAPNVLSINLGFTSYFLPENSRLTIYSTDYGASSDQTGLLTFSELDNEIHGELWTPVILSDDIIIELLLPTTARYDYQLKLTSINRGYRYFGETQDRAGWCNIDVVCPEGDDWREEINSVAVATTGGSTFCTGFMVNNTAQDQTPYFMTARHCGINGITAPSLVVFWNFQSPVCGQQSGGSLSDFQTGSTFLANGEGSDYTLLLLDDPVDPTHEVSFAGWDNSGQDVHGAVAIHHPSADEKSISFEYDSTTTTSFFDDTSPGNGTHIRVEDWDMGSTESGSSGSPLFDMDHRVIGQLHGGYAFCGNDMANWYGKFSVSWAGLAPHLDPLATGATTLDTLAPWASGMGVRPSSVFSVQGEVGGPFIPERQNYTLLGRSDETIDYEVSVDQSWLTVIDGEGSILPDDNANVTVIVNESAGSLPKGLHHATITFTNLTNGDGNTTRTVELLAGLPDLIYSFNMDSDPGWQREGEWEWGVPLGGGTYAYPDPISGYTGPHVLGYNLAGDYPDNLPVTSVVTNPLDCSSLEGTTLKFWRWLGVESSTWGDHAYISISVDGEKYTPIWSNQRSIYDGAWTQKEYDISAIADGQPSVTIAWSMGPTNNLVTYCGWNIDDVEIWAHTDTPMTVSLIPHNPPIQIQPQGGSFSYDIEFTTGQAGSYDVVFEVTLPDSSVRTIRTFSDIDLAAGSYSWPNIVQNIPGSVPLGTYIYRIIVSNEVGGSDSSEFEIVKLIPARKRGKTTINNWKLKGF